MKKRLLLAQSLVFSTLLFSQVGINTASPKATLDVTGYPADTSKLDGVIVPKISGDQLAAKTYTIDQTGAILYITSPASVLTGQVVNADAAGFYYYDGSKWMKTGVSSVNLYNTNGTLTGNRTANLNGNSLNFSGTGNVGIGGVSTIAKLNVNGFIQFGPTDSHYGVGRVVNDGAGEKYGLTQPGYFPAIGNNGSSAGTRIYTSGRSGVEGNISFGKYTSATAYTEWARFAPNTGYFGLNTYDPKATFEMVSTPADLTRIDGFITPKLTGNQLKAKDDLYTIEQTGAILYVTSAANPTTIKTANIIKSGYYYFDGNVWVGIKPEQSAISDAARSLGGTVYAKFNSAASGTLSDSRTIGGINGSSYTVGVNNFSSNKGGINTVIGNGYTISNPANGIFDIKFDVPLSEVYGVSSNVVDSYGYNGGVQAGTTNGTNPLPGEPGSRLNTKENTQVSFVSNTVIRIKTGDQDGNLANRSFTFLVTGK